MSKKLSRSDALEDISTWSTNDVLCLLQKNGLKECCAAVAKRQIDGDELLHLTEGKLALWKSDLTRPLIWALCTLVEEVKKCPEKYVEEKSVEVEQSEDHMSDTGSWDTDFEDEAVEDNTALDDTRNINVSQINSNYINDHGISQKVKNANADVPIDNSAQEQEEDTTYANYEISVEQEKIYANYKDSVPNFPLKNVSRLHGSAEKTLAEKLKEELEMRNAKKPALGPKPAVIVSKRIENLSLLHKLPQKSFLHTEAKARPISSIQRRMAVPPPPAPKKNIDQSFPAGKIDKDVIKASLSIRNLDLVANLPTRTHGSEDEYEEFDEQIIEQNQKSALSRIDSKQSLTSCPQSSVESVYQPPSTTSCEDEEEPYEIYESITETPEDNGYLSPIQRPQNSPVIPPPLPFKPSQTPSPTPTLTRPSVTNNANERSPDKKSATLPHSGSNSSLLSERATRPLPPPPERLSYVDKPWFHNVTREEAKALIREQGTFGIPQDGYFLLRPSMTNVNNPLALVLWCRDRFYNIPVRKRPDNRYALGSAKVNEQSFSSVEEIVTFYMNEELVLHTGDITKLTDTPPK
ncbi:hypothetical protein KPH14_005883 [Odynerus spinipes]|uniref:SH2 domain-containing protein n=1 Tax=Odynerus spinipes TaxID=1348599 RepID=A0AAD9VKG3_9HYME|nr:hypothetical protein KPH14_005883 [Odynerus spinipes]